MKNKIFSSLLISSFFFYLVATTIHFHSFETPEEKDSYLLCTACTADLPKNAKKNSYEQKESHKEKEQERDCQICKIIQFSHYDLSGSTFKLIHKDNTQKLFVLDDEIYLESILQDNQSRAPPHLL